MWLSFPRPMRLASSSALRSARPAAMSSPSVMAACNCVAVMFRTAGRGRTVSHGTNLGGEFEFVSCVSCS